MASNDDSFPDLCQEPNCPDGRAPCHTFVPDKATEATLIERVQTYLHISRQLLAPTSIEAEAEQIIQAQADEIERLTTELGRKELWRANAARVATGVERGLYDQLRDKDAEIERLSGYIRLTEDEGKRILYNAIGPADYPDDAYRDVCRTVEYIVNEKRGVGCLVVTDEMVERALTEFASYHGMAEPGRDDACLFCMRKALEAALKP